MDLAHGLINPDQQMNLCWQKNCFYSIGKDLCCKNLFFCSVFLSLLFGLFKKFRFEKGTVRCRKRSANCLFMCIFVSMYIKMVSSCLLFLILTIFCLWIVKSTSLPKLNKFIVKYLSAFV